MHYSFKYLFNESLMNYRDVFQLKKITDLSFYSEIFTVINTFSFDYFIKLNKTNKKTVRYNLLILLLKPVYKKFNSKCYLLIKIELN